jgi:hypothetical protein
MPDIKLTARLDHTQVMSGLHELRSQLGMSLASATGFQGAATALSSQPNLGGSGFGQTHTNPAMAMSPHYGALQATTSLAQERAIASGGLGAAHQMKPPGVSAASYAASAMGNAIDRDIQANQQSAMAARAAFYTGAAGLATGEVGGIGGAMVGKMIGGAVGGRFFGAGGVKAGQFVGGLAGGLGGFMLGQDVGEKWQGKKFAQIEQTLGVTKELGQIAGGGRGLNRLEEYNLGTAARKAAKDLNMDVNQMGDTLALGRQSGMLPSATDPSKFRQQAREFAQAIEESAQVLKTSLAGATQVIKQGAASGMSAQEATVRAAGTEGGASAWLAQQSRMNAFGSAGASVGMSMGFTPGQGRAMFTGSMGAAGQAGLSGAETKIMGGRMGAAQFVGSTQMAMASSQTGDLQLMAAMGGGGDGTMMGMAGAAMGAMSEGGDFMSNMGKFMVHKNEYRRGVGAKGIRTMARAQLKMGGDMISEFMPDLSNNEAQRLYAQSMGMNPDQAKTLVGGGRGGGGGGRGAMKADNQARAVIAMQGTRLDALGVTEISGADMAAKDASGGLGWGNTLDGAMLGGTAGSVIPGVGTAIGAVVGGIGGFVQGNWDALNKIGGGPPSGLNSEEKADWYGRKAAGEYDKRMAEAKSSIGFYDLNQKTTSNFLSKDLSRSRLDFNAAGSMGTSSFYESDSGATVEERTTTGHERTVGQMEAFAIAAGLEEVEPGAPGSIKIGDKYHRIDDVQKMANQPLYAKGGKEGGIEKGKDAAYYAGFSKKAASRYNEEKFTTPEKLKAIRDLGIGRGDLQEAAAKSGHEGWEGVADKMPETLAREREQIGMAWDTLASGKGGEQAIKAARTLGKMLPGFIENIDETASPEAAASKKAMQEAMGGGGVFRPEIQAFASGLAGRDLETLSPKAALTAATAGGAAGQHALDSMATREGAYLADVYGGKMRSSGSRDRTLNTYLESTYGTKAVSDIEAALTPGGKEVLARSKAGDSILVAAKAQGFKGALFKDGDTDEDRATKSELLTEQVGRRKQGADFDKYLQGSGMTGGLAKTDIDRQFGNALASQKDYLMMKASILEGDDDKAQKFLDTAKRRVLSSGTFEGYDPGEIKINDKVAYQKGAQERVDVMKAQDGMLGLLQKVLPGGVVDKWAGEQRAYVGKDVQKQVLEKVSLKDNVLAEFGKGGEGNLGDKPTTKKKKGRGVLQNAAGFGQRESAMASINKSLRHTERMLKITLKRFPEAT